jgi:cytidylate kinase
MAEEHNGITAMQAITISREYGSGGGEIAVRLAQRLGWRLVDHEVVVRVAQELGVTEEEAEAYDERAEGIVARILTSLQMIQPSILVATPTMSMTTDAEEYNEARRRVIDAAVKTGHVVIVGRGAQVLLADRRDVLHVRIVAPLNMRIKYVMQREGLDANAARSRVQLKDRDRVRYLQAQHRVSPEDPHLYDLTVNTSIISLDNTVDLIKLALESKAARLSTPVEELGPAVGLSRYPEQPEDFRTPENMTSSTQ